MSDFDILVRDQGPVRELALSHPARRNALHDPLLARLSDELDRAQAGGIRCLLIRGEGELAFCAGYDLSVLPAATEAGPLPDATLEAVLGKLDRLAIPTVAFLNGPAFGAGLELAARCDLRIAAGGIKLGMPPAKLGILYAAEGLARFAALMGPARAKALFLTGAPIAAEGALAAGLVDEVHPRAEAEARAWALAEAIAANAPLAVQGMKRIFQALAAAPLFAIDREEVVRLRRAAFASDDAREGRAAFLEKRQPAFKGR